MGLDKTTDPNMEFMVKLKAGEPALRILLSQRRAKKQSTQEAQGEVPETYDEGILPARHGDTKLYGGPSYINFYDLGRKWDGSQFLDVSFSVHPTYDYVISGSGVASYRTTTVPTLSQLEALQAAIIDYPIKEIETNHPRITQEEGQYFYLLLGDLPIESTSALTNEAWTDKGWKVRTAQVANKLDFVVGASQDLTSSTPATMEATEYFHRVVLTGPNKMTITNVNDPDGPVVSYRPRAKDKIFLMPAMPRPNGWTQYRDAGTSHGLGTAALRIVQGYQSYDFMVIPRTPIFDIDSPYYRMPFRNANSNSFTWNPSGPSSNADDVIQYDGANRIVNFMQAYGTASELKEAVNLLAIGNDYSWHTYVGTGFPPASFFPDAGPPTSEAPSPRWIFGAGAFYGTSLMNAPAAIQSSNPALPSGALMAIIKQGSAIFYVWR